jgi:putative transposase
MKLFRYPYREKKHRLDPEIYRGKILVSFTLCIKNRKELFVSNDIFSRFESILLKELAEGDVSAQIYLFMPDHVHLILSGREENTDILKCLNSYKKQTGFWLYKNKPSIKWQKDYYDHILRKEEDLETIIKYILNNPVRAGLVDNWKQYQFKGSTIFNLNEWE